jgi:hypothetical protein
MTIPVKYKFFTRMFVATFCAWAVPHIAYRFMQLHLGAITITFSVNSLFLLALGLAMVSGFGIGLQVSLLQWLAMRPYIESPWRWLVGLVVVWVLGDALGMILLFSTPFSWGHTQSALFQLIGKALALGIFAGLIQQNLLQKRTGVRIWWAIATFFSVSGALVLDQGNLTLREGYALIDPIYASLLAGTVMAVLASLPTLLLRPTTETTQHTPVVEPEPTAPTGTELLAN